METCDAPKRAAALYAPDGVLWGTEVHAPDDPLWGTVTEEVRDTPERIYAYYVSPAAVAALNAADCRACLLLRVCSGTNRGRSP